MPDYPIIAHLLFIVAVGLPIGGVLIVQAIVWMTDRRKPKEQPAAWTIDITHR